jgi:TPR repeat protein
MPLIPRVDRDAAARALFASDLPFAILLQGFLASEGQRYESAIECYRRLGSSPLATNNLAKLILIGDKSPERLREAAMLFVGSAEQGYAIGQHNAGYAFMHGIGVEADSSRMHAYMRQAADQGYVESMCIFAMEARGFDLAESARYLRGAA